MAFSSFPSFASVEYRARPPVWKHTQKETKTTKHRKRSCSRKSFCSQVGRILSCAAAAREGGCARGWKSHPWNWTVHHGTARCLSLRKAARGVSSPGIEPMGLNEDEPQQMSSVTDNTRSRRVSGAWMKADVCAADNRQPAQSPAESAWQARRDGQSQIKRGGLRR